MSLRTALSDWVFNWFKSGDQVNNPTKRQRRSPVNVDYTDSMQCNAELTKGLYHNSYPGMKLAGAMAYTPIATPIWFMGIPAAITDNDDINEILNKIVEDKIEQFSEIHTQAHRDGTCWIFPHYSKEESNVVWEFIQDEVISDIIRDINTGKIIKLITDEDILISIDYNKTANVRRQRIFTETKVETKWLAGSNSIPGHLKDSAKRNVAGVIPIPFANNKDGNEVRGHSDYERILSDLKNYHDIDYKWSLYLSKFGPKMVVELQDVNQWLTNNGYGDINDINIATDDIFLNYFDKEKVTYVFPEGAFLAYDQALKKTFRKLVEGSNIPEILWGNKVSGNLGSYEDQMDMVVKLVNEKRRQKTKSYKTLFLVTLQLELSANIQNMPDEEIRIEWDYLDAISEETKSIIFKNFAEGMSTLINAAGITKEQAWKLFVKLYPGVTEDKLEEYKKGITEMAAHVQYTKMPYELAADFRGQQDVDANLNATNRDLIYKNKKLMNNIGKLIKGTLPEDEKSELLKYIKNIKDPIDIAMAKNRKKPPNLEAAEKEVIVKEQPINITVKNEQPKQPKINIDVKTPEIKIPEMKIPKQPMVINLNEKNKSKKVVIKKDKNNNIIGAEIKEDDA